MPDSKNTFSPNSSNQNDFFKKIGWYTFLLLYLWALYELIWLHITAQTVTLGAKILKNIKCNPRSPKWSDITAQTVTLGAKLTKTSKVTLETPSARNFWIKMTPGSKTFIEKSGNKI